jgi:hypothetical protein
MWKYREVYMPSHPKARANGCVLEHRVVAEQKIGRILKDEEVVHHIDSNRENNNEDNLIVFATLKDHSRFHATGTMVETSECGVFISPVIVNQCSGCGVEFETNLLVKKYCSSECYHLSNRKSDRPNKKELEGLLRKYNFTKVGEIFGVSCNAIRKWCRVYGLPTTSKYYRN